jgi:hypothetical protein
VPKPLIIIGILFWSKLRGAGVYTKVSYLKERAGFVTLVNPVICLQPVGDKVLYSRLQGIGIHFVPDGQQECHAGLLNRESNDFEVLK